MGSTCRKNSRNRIFTVKICVFSLLHRTRKKTSTLLSNDSKMTSLTTVSFKVFGLLFFLLCFYVSPLDTSSWDDTLLTDYKSSIDRFRIRLHTTLEDGRIRRTRSIRDDSQDRELFHFLNQVELTQDVTTVKIWSLVNAEVVFAVTNNSHISIYQDSKFVSLHQFPSDNEIYSLLAFHHGNGLWLIALYLTKDSVHFMQVYEYKGDHLNSKQIIKLQGFSHGSLSVVERIPYLVLITNGNFGSLVTLFVWTGNQLDELEELELSLKSRCSGLVSWEKDKVLYIAVNLLDKNQLVIYRFAKYLESFIPAQVIEGKFNDIDYFKHGSSVYLVCGIDNKINLFWWSGSEFLKQQELFTNTLDSLVDISALVSTDYGAVIIGVKKKQLEYFTQDTSSTFVSKSTYSLDSSLNNVCIWKHNDKLYILPVFEDHSAKSIFELVKNFSAPALPIEHKAGKCVQDLYKAVKKSNEKVLELSSRMCKVWRKNEIGFVNFVHVLGDVKSNGSVNITAVSFNEGLNASQFMSANTTSVKIKEKTDFYRNSVHTAVLKSENQNITGTISFKKGLQAVQGSIGTLSRPTVTNKVPTSMLLKALKKNEDQKFKFEYTFENVVVGSMDIKFLNDIFVEDFLRLNDSSKISGNLTFEKVTAQTMDIENEAINGLPISHIVTTSLHQNITDGKMFSLLVTNSLVLTDYVAGVNISTMNKIIDFTRPLFESPVTFTSNVVVDAITLHSINDLSIIDDLLMKSVSINGNQTITGPKKFVSLHVEDFYVKGNFNELNLNDLMTLHSAQNISSNVSFNNASFNNMETHLVNGMDLCSEAVIKHGNFSVNGEVTFLSSLNVSSIVMEKNASINTIDISEYERNFTTFLLSDNLEVGSIKVLNDAYIEDMNMNLLLQNLSNNVWSKAKNQTISEAKFNMVSMHDMVVPKINDILFDDIVLKDKNATLSSDKTFENASVLTLGVKNMKTLNDIPITQDMIEALDQISVINAKDISVEGSITVDAINDVELFDFMHVQMMQNCSGTNFFNATKIQNLEVHDLNLNSFNGTKFADYEQTAVLKAPYKVITNTEFKNLIGGNLETKGFLNGEQFDEIIQSVVTLNSKQNISNANFWEGVVFKGVCNSKSGLLDFTKVVPKYSELYNISHKVFTGSVTAADMGLSTPVAGVDIVTLKKLAFYKSKKNFLSHPVKLLSGMKSKTVHLSSHSKIDDVYLNDTIATNKNSNTNYMNFSNVHSKSLTVYGKVNLCYLWDLLVPNNCTGVMAEKYLTHFKVDGNLIINSSLNKISLKDLDKGFSYLDKKDHIERDVFFSNIKAVNLQVGSLNNIKIKFLIDDAVKFKELKVIKGKKILTGGLISRKTSVDSLKVSNLCGINMHHTFSRYVRKNNEQRLFIRNIYQVKAKKVTIKNFLNDLKIPDDVVLVSSDEFIPSILMNSTAEFNSNLVVGSLNGFDLDHLVNNRITLKSQENISSSLMFLKDVPLMELEVLGSINNISITEAVTTMANHGIQGSKTFEEKLAIKSHWFVNQVNDSSLDDLNWICLKEKNEYISKTVIFKDVEATELEVNQANNISLEGFWDAIKSTQDIFSSVQLFFRSNTSFSKEILLKMKDDTKDVFPSFGFFEIHQELHVSPTSQFLPIHVPGISGDGYELPTSEMIIWENQNKSCETFKSLQMVANSTGFLSYSYNFQGRIFPFPLSNPNDVEAFFLHTYMKENCISTNSLKTVFKDGSSINFTLDTPNFLNCEILQAQLLELENGTFLLVSYSFEGSGDRIWLYEYFPEVNTWTLKNSFHSWDVSSYDVLFVIDSPIAIHLVVTNGETEPGIYHYKWNFKDGLFKEELTYFNRVTTAVKWIRDDDDNVFLLLAKEKSKIKKGTNWEDVYSEPIEVYLLEKDVLKFHHIVNLKGISSFETFHFEGELYVLAVSSYFQTIHILQYRGSNGFEAIQEIEAPGVVKVTLFTSKDESLLLAVSSITEHSKILKCMTKGNLDQYN